MRTHALQPRPVSPRVPPRGRRAFTLMELVMGMIVTGLVMSAIAALLSAVAMGWEQNGKSQANSVHRVQVHARLQRILKGVKQLGAVRPGSVNGTTNPPPNNTATVSSVVVTPASQTIVQGQTATFTAQALTAAPTRSPRRTPPRRPPRHRRP